MDTLLQDLRFAVRSLRRTPGFAFTVIAVMALGIGVNSFIYTALRAILFADLPFAEPDRIVSVLAQNTREGGSGFEMSLPDTRDVMERARTLECTAAWDKTSAFVTVGGDAQRFAATMATDALPRVLGVQPVVGRWFTPQECTYAGRFGPVVLGYRVWKDQFSANHNVLGRKLSMNGRVRTVVGVMPENFRFPDQSEFFVPLAVDDTANSRGGHWLDVAGRLAPGAKLNQARAELKAIAADNARAFPATNEHMTLLATPFRDELSAGPRPALIMLALAVMFVLLIACANVANLQLARATARTREIGVRIAMGATRWRLVRQMITESLLLSVAGGALGVLIGQWGMNVTMASIPETMPYWMHFRLDLNVVLVTLAVSVFAGLAFGVGPAIHATAGDPLMPLREGTPGGGDSPASRRLRGTLVVAELALAVVLLIGSGLMVRSFLWQVNQRHALKTDGVLTGCVTLPAAIYKDDAARVAFFRELRETLAGMPGVTAVGGVLNLHLGSSNWTQSIQREGIDQGHETEQPYANFNVITPGYLATVGIPVHRGRDFNESDAQDSPRVCIVNETAARELWPKADPIGKRWRFGEHDTLGWVTVVGVVGDVRQRAQSENMRVAEVMVPHAQFANQSLTWALRSSLSPGVLAGMVRRVLRERDPNLPFYEVRTLNEHIRLAIWEPRLYAQLMTAFSILALVIAALGIYGVMAYTVARRTREIGIRMALGAARADVQRLVVGQALRLTLIGAGIGLALALGLTRFMQSQLSGVHADDPPTFVGVTLILALSSAAAAWLPTARAVRVDPVVALRHE